MNTSFLKKVISVGLVLPGLAIGSIGMSGFFVAQTLVANAAVGGPICNVPADYATIQGAVNDAGCTTINVAAGTYAEQVAVNRSVTLNGANMGIAGNGVRVAESIVDGSSTSTPFVITANGVTINGFKVQNGSNGGFFSGIWSQTGTQNSSIMDNIITNNDIGVWAQCGGNCMISDNLFDGNNQAGPDPAGISADSTTGLTINHNEFENHTAGNPILLQATHAGAHTNVIVSNNSMHNNANTNVYSIGITGGTFSGNTITPAVDSTGLGFEGADSNITVTNNVISNGARGVRVEDAGFGLGGNGSTTVNRNDVSNDSDFGVGNSPTSSPALDATCNWWGAANGPGPVGLGSGSPVTANVSFVSWLTSSDLTSACNGTSNAPVISNVSIKSNNANPSIAKNGDIITLTFTTDQPVTKLGNFKINGSNPDTFTNVGNNYTATHLVDSGDPITGVPATFQINVKSAAGIFSQTIEATNDGSSVTIVSAVSLEAEDFGVVSFDTGLGFLKGYTAGFGLHGGPTFASSSVSSVVMQLFASSTLLQTNSSTPKVGATITGTQISSPFDVSGNFDYVADGFWNNVRQPEFGQTLAATRVVATVTLVDGTVLTAENDHPTGDPTTIMPTGMLMVQKIALGGSNTFSFTSDNGLAAFTIMTLPTSTKTVNSSGSVTFSVTPGTYHITEATTTGWTLMTNGCSAVIVAATGTTTCTVTNAKLGEIKGTKFEDENGNGAVVKNDDGDNNGKDNGGDNHNSTSTVKSEGDNHGNNGDGDNNDNEDNNNRPVAGVTIFLDANNNGVLDAGEVSTTTDSHGNYDFMGLIPGLFHVREVVQPGWMQTAPASGVFDITLAPGQVSKRNDFLNFKLGSISGMKFNDMNSNGKKDSGDVGLSGWTIVLTGPTSATSTMVTDASGTYSFANLGPGTYKLSEVLQTGWVQTAHPGSVKVRSGTASMNNNFGNHLTSVVVTAARVNKGHD